MKAAPFLTSSLLFLLLLLLPSVAASLTSDVNVTVNATTVEARLDGTARYLVTVHDNGTDSLDATYNVSFNNSQSAATLQYNATYCILRNPAGGGRPTTCQVEVNITNSTTGTFNLTVNASVGNGAGGVKTRQVVTQSTFTGVIVAGCVNLTHFNEVGGYASRDGCGNVTAVGGSYLTMVTTNTGGTANLTINLSNATTPGIGPGNYVNRVCVVTEVNSSVDTAVTNGMNISIWNDDQARYISINVTSTFSATARNETTCAAIPLTPASRANAHSRLLYVFTGDSAADDIWDVDYVYANLTFNGFPCNYNLSTGEKLFLESNQSCPGSAVHSGTSKNVILDCQGYGITYATGTNGIGVNITSGGTKYNITDCNFFGGAASSNVGISSSGEGPLRATNNTFWNKSGLFTATGAVYNFIVGNYFNITGIQTPVQLNGPSTVFENNTIIFNSSSALQLFSITFSYNSTIKNTFVSTNSTGSSVFILSSVANYTFINMTSIITGTAKGTFFVTNTRGTINITSSLFNHTSTSLTWAGAVFGANNATLNISNTSILMFDLRINISTDSRSTMMLDNVTLAGTNTSITIPYRVIEPASTSMLTNRSFYARYNSSFVNGSLHGFLNTTLRFTFRNLPWTDALVQWSPLDDGSYQDCPASVCAEESYSGGILVFNVTRAGMFRTIEAAPPPAPPPPPANPVAAIASNPQGASSSALLQVMNRTHLEAAG